ncbi:hypothetical protein PLICRDRAFT_504372 [Plicaturopsis crispa FD-325 SS-3]|nr:hypothetical protein PLICRDRAFT_504372 [Plicaturopsis crispa FD-325 SS-3]
MVVGAEGGASFRLDLLFESGTLILFDNDFAIGHHPGSLTLTPSTGLPFESRSSRMPFGIWSAMESSLCVLGRCHFVVKRVYQSCHVTIRDVCCAAGPWLAGKGGHIFRENGGQDSDKTTLQEDNRHCIPGRQYGALRKSSEKRGRGTRTESRRNQKKSGKMSAGGGGDGMDGCKTAQSAEATKRLSRQPERT